MSSTLYHKLAVTNLKNNRKTYVPYILAAVLCVMMFYMIDVLSRSGSIGVAAMQLCLQYAKQQQFGNLYKTSLDFML